MSALPDDRFGLACALISGGHLEDTAGVNLEGNLNLR